MFKHSIWTMLLLDVYALCCLAVLLLLFSEGPMPFFQVLRN